MLSVFFSCSTLSLGQLNKKWRSCQFQHLIQKSKSPFSFGQNKLKRAYFIEMLLNVAASWPAEKQDFFLFLLTAAICADESSPVDLDFSRMRRRQKSEHKAATKRGQSLLKFTSKLRPQLPFNEPNYFTFRFYWRTWYLSENGLDSDEPAGQRMELSVKQSDRYRNRDHRWEQQHGTNIKDIISPQWKLIRISCTSGLFLNLIP